MRAWLAAWGALPLLALSAWADARTPQPTIAIARAGTHCLAAPDVMRREHPDMLKHQRTLTVREGKRGMPASLNACIACHATGTSAVGSPAGTAEPRADGAGDEHSSAEPTSAQTKTAGPGAHFCESCHAYAAVKLDCFECHAKTPRAMAQQAGAGEGKP